MSDERIDVEVTDKVDAGVAKKLNQIADAADRGESHLKRLQTALSNVNATALDRLAAAMAKMDSAQAKLISSQARLTNAQNAGSVAASKVALANQKIATEAARTEAAQARAAAATTAAEGAAMRLSAAQGRVTGASNAAASATNASATAATHAGAAYNGATAGANAFAGASTRAAGGANQMGAAANSMATGLNRTAGAANQHARAVRTANFANANIIAQMQDIGVSLAGGQNPLLVLIQQGSQLSYIASTLQGGWKQLMATVARMVLGFAPLLTILGLLAIAFKTLKTESEKAADLDKFVQTLGLTRREIKQLDDVTITWGDTWNATMRVLAEGMGTTTAEITSKWDSMWARIGKITVAFISVVLGLFVGLMAGVASAIVNIGKAVGAFFIGIINVASKAFEKLVNFAITGANLVASAVNKVFDTDIKPLESWQAPTIDIDFKFTNPLEDAAKEAKQFSEFIQGEFSKIGKYQEEEAKKRLRAQALEIIKDRTPKQPKKEREDHTAERRAHAIEMVNMKLDDELARMKLLKDERAIQQRMDQIEEGLAQKKIKLNEQERATIEGKVRAIEAYKYVQAEMDRIYESAVAPMRTYQASLQAITDLLARGTITAQRAAEEQVKASRAYQEAVDPLFAMKEAMASAEAASIHYGVALQRHNYYEQIRQQLLTRGIVLSAQYVAGVNAEADALMRKNDALMQQQFIQSTIGGITDPITQDQMLIDNKERLYAELDRMADAHEITEKQRIQARFALEATLMQKRLQQYSQMFGDLSSLSQSGNKKLALIGKAAAVAQATIDGVLAVQKALGSAPPPLNFALAAAAGIAAAMNVAKIVSTPVGGFATGGQFMVGGKSGIDANNINMNVTRGERVTVETRAQQKANDNRPTQGAPTTVVVKNVNVSDPRDIVAVLDTNEGEQKVLNIIQNNPEVLRRLMG